MKYLLDTHVFLWLDGEPTRLSQRVLDIFADDSNSFLLSMASVWELQIKLQLGKLKLNSPLADLLTANQTYNQVQLLPITLEHVLTLASLPDYHRDPFDRMLIAQAISEKVALITNDKKVMEYTVQWVW